MHHCKTCNKTLFEEKDNFSICYINYEISHYLCDECVNTKRMEMYKNKGEISSRLWLDASLYESRKEYRFHKLREETLEFYEKYGDLLDKVNQDMEIVQKSMKEFETHHWIDWLCDFYAKENGGWEYKDTDLNDFSLSVLGSAGRVLISIKDLYPTGDERSKFNGAWITLIFADNDKSGNGGIQGLCASKEEAVSLLQAAINMPKNALKVEENLFIV